MCETMFDAELQYQTAIAIAKNLRSQGLLTEDEYAVIDTKLQAVFSPSLGTLLSENDLINRGFRVIYSVGKERYSCES